MTTYLARVLLLLFFIFWKLGFASFYIYEGCDGFNNVMLFKDKLTHKIVLLDKMQCSSEFVSCISSHASSEPISLFPSLILPYLPMKPNRD